MAEKKKQVEEQTNVAISEQTTDVPTKKKVVGKPFEKGKSGNPSGRPKIPKELKDACKEFTPRAIEILIDMANSKSARDSDRLRAIEMILDRGYGKPAQEVQVDTKNIPQVVFVGGDQILE